MPRACVSLREKSPVLLDRRCRLLLCLAALGPVACGTQISIGALPSSGPDEAGAVDGGSASDVESPDAVFDDAAQDAGPIDAGGPDGGDIDGGSPPDL
jgi:hypothetical protein